MYSQFTTSEMVSLLLVPTTFDAEQIYVPVSFAVTLKMIRDGDSTFPPPYKLVLLSGSIINTDPSMFFSQLRLVRGSRDVTKQTRVTDFPNVTSYDELVMCTFGGTVI